MGRYVVQTGDAIFHFERKKSKESRDLSLSFILHGKHTTDPVASKFAADIEKKKKKKKKKKEKKKSIPGFTKFYYMYIRNYWLDLWEKYPYIVPFKMLTHINVRLSLSIHVLQNWSPTDLHNTLWHHKLVHLYDVSGNKMMAILLTPYQKSIWWFMEWFRK